jgi:23S rRNA pseudouridine1911/1915/1917 synthase
MENPPDNRIVDETLAGMRLDQAAARLFPDYSRSRLQQCIRDGELLINGQPANVRDKVMGGEELALRVAEVPQVTFGAEEIPLDVVYEDSEVLVINKPAGLVVHPAAGNYTGTLLNGLLSYCPALELLPRAGIVHRLDKDTSGLMVVARTPAAHQSLINQLQDRTVSRQYDAVVQGAVTAGGTVDEPIGRHPTQRTKRAVSRAADAKEAVTHYRVQSRFRSHTLLRMQLETGRTHQIRVHLAHIGYPIVGDMVYGGRMFYPKGASPQLLDFIQHFRRQALHARILGFIHPVHEEYMEWECDLPDDMQQLLALLEQDRA